jgi:hypothetical protein
VLKSRHDGKRNDPGKNPKRFAFEQRRRTLLSSAGAHFGKVAWFGWLDIRIQGEHVYAITRNPGYLFPGGS